jgi:hypothetical protein
VAKYQQTIDVPASVSEQAIDKAVRKAIQGTWAIVEEHRNTIICRRSDLSG